MSESSHGKPTPMLSNSAYNVVKKSATIVFPALSALYIAIAQIWNFDHVEQVVGTLTAVNTFLGVLIQLSKKSYYASSAPYVGEIKVKNVGEKKVVAQVHIRVGSTDPGVTTFRRGRIFYTAYNETPTKGLLCCRT
jgi:hypothetical protein